MNKVLVALAVIALISIVAYFVLMSSRIPISGQYLFKDGFESGSFSAWTNSRLTNGLANVINTDQHAGSYAGKFTISAVAGLCGASAYTTITPAASLYARGYFKLMAIPFAVEGDRVYLITFETGSPNYGDVAFAGVARTWDGQNRWQLLARNGSAYVMASYFTSTVTVGRYYSVELYWTCSVTGAVRMYVDGLMILELTNIDTSLYGNAKLIHFGIAQKEGTSAFTFEVHVDDCVVDDAHIGM